jgi:phosphate transport system substrate-binding protein
MKKIILIGLVAVLAVGLIGCGWLVKEEVDSNPTFHLEEFERVDGSTVTTPFTQGVVHKLFGIEDSEVINHTQTTNAIENVITGERDIAFVTYPSEEELTGARERGIELEIVPVINDAFVFIVNRENPVDGLASEQIRGIYSGRITNWNQVGGHDGEIVALQRNEGSGSQSGMIRFMGDTPLISQLHNVEREMGGMIERVATAFDPTKSVIGYSYFYYANNMFIRENIKMLAIDGIPPSSEMIQSGEYPLVASYYAVIRADEPEGSFARRLLEFVLSDAGQEIVEKMGYVKVR